MYTMKQWNESGKPFSEFAKAKNEVDEEIFYYFLEVLPPHYNRSGIMQVGEPFTHIKGIPAFETFTYSHGKYFYVGIVTSQRS